MTDSLICSNCRVADEPCTFDLPLGRRGPKTKRQKELLAHSTAPAVTAVAGATAGLSAASGESTATTVSVSPPTLCLSRSRASWEPGLAEPALSSPQTARSLSHSDSSSTRSISSLQRWHELARALRLRDPVAQLETTVNRCFDLFFAYLFPLIPLVHEPSLRDGLNFFVSSTRHAEAAASAEVPSSFVQGSNPGDTDNLLDRTNSLKYPELWPDSTFTLITAVCAEAAFLLPKSIFPEGEAFAELFLQASRNCLNSYLEADLEYPNANSVAIRYFHSNCVHAAGKPRFSWHIFGEATRLAQVMQMHEEKSLTKLSPLEAELRRRAFWIVYTGDKSAAILNNRPITIHKFSFESGITTAFPTGIEDEISLSPGQPANTPGVAAAAAVTAVPVPDALSAPRKSFIAGFNANLRLWQAAADLILEMRLLENQNDAPLVGGQRLLSTEKRNRVDQLYVLFMTSLDDLPSYLQTDIFTIASAQGPAAVQAGHGLEQYVLQSTNLHVSYYCLKMVIIQKFEELKFYDPATDQNDLLLLRKTEIARDMLRVIREAPFWALQVNGEPCVSYLTLLVLLYQLTEIIKQVEKIRLIGASLLEIIDRNEPSPLSVRARNDLTILLDVLSRLDSKASDTLRRTV